MTLPNERRNSINMTREFLYRLLDPKQTPRVPKEVRDMARRCLRHYPSEFYMDQAKKAAPKVFGEWDE